MRFKVGVLGATGMVGQRFVWLLSQHPWFELTVVAASPRSAGKTYEEAVGSRWVMPDPIADSARSLILLDATKDAQAIASSVDFVFSAVDMKKEEIYQLELAYAKLECPVISNNSAHRTNPGVPMIVPEINPEHADVIHQFRSENGLKRGFIAVKSNCSLQSYVPALHPLRQFGLNKVLVCTYQAISGAGKTFETWPEMKDNIIPYIGGEEEKSEKEPLKLWGTLTDHGIVNATKPAITAQCIRVPVSNGHMAAVFASFDNPPPIEKIASLMENYVGLPQKLNLPSAPKQFLHVFSEPDRPQAALERDLENGMAVSVGRIREDSQYDIKFVCLSHNTLRGAAGGGVLLAELLCQQGFIESRF